MLAQKAWRMIRTLIFTYLVSGVLLTALAFALYKFRLPESQITLGISGVYILSCFMGGFMAGKAMRSRKFLWGLLTGILYFAFLLIMSFLQDRTITADAVRLGTVFAMCSLSAMAGGMISGQKKEAPRSVSGARALSLFSVFIYFQLLPWHRPPEPEDRSQRKYRPCPAT